MNLENQDMTVYTICCFLKIEKNVVQSPASASLNPCAGGMPGKTQAHFHRIIIGFITFKSLHGSTIETLKFHIKCPCLPSRDLFS